MEAATRKEKGLFKKFVQAKSLVQAEKIAQKMKDCHNIWEENQAKITNLCRIEQMFAKRPTPKPTVKTPKLIPNVPIETPQIPKYEPTIGFDSTGLSYKVKELITEQLGVDPAKVDLKASIVNDLGADSLDIVELAMAFEEDFDMEIPDADIERMRTVKDVQDYLKKVGKL